MRVFSTTFQAALFVDRIKRSQFCHRTGDIILAIKLSKRALRKPLHFGVVNGQL